MMLLTRMFHLSKWYLDCVTADGQVFLAYWARLRWRALTLNYSSVLDGPCSIKPCPEPACAGDRVEWHAPELGVDGVWHALDPAASRTLYDSNGAVDWHCVLPRGRAEIRYGNQCLHGLGYVEQLTMTVPPWRLPIDELHWGRLLTESGSLVWIDWRGPSPLQVVLRNGVLADSALVAEVHLDRSLVLRDGVLGGTALSVVPRIDRLFPFRILQVQETKWRSHGVLDGVSGWAIHEVVRWP